MKFARGTYALGICDRCGQQYDYVELRKEWNNLKVCPECFETKHPQLEPITVQFEPQALHEPRTDRTEPFPSINNPILQGITFIGTVTVTT